MCLPRVFSLILILVSLIVVLIESTNAIELTTTTTTKPPGVCSNKLLVIGVDGFRYDYFDKIETPTLHWLAQTGVHAKTGLTASFITKTFPNFWTIATGLYQEKHGIIDNSFYDPIWKEKFKLGPNSTRTAKWFDNATPIWIAAEKAGLRSGIYFWPGSEVEINGTRPTFWRRFNHRTSVSTRVNTVADWLTSDLVDLAMVYFNEPDHTAHSKGTWSPDTQAAVQDMDRTIGTLMGKLNQNDCLQDLNILVVSDQGMTDIFVDLDRPRSHLLSLSKYIDLKNDVEDIPQAGAIAAIVPKIGKENNVFNALNGNPHWKVYFKDQLPERYHYKLNYRIAPIILIADEGFLISRGSTYGNNYIGQHGYDNQLLSMRPLFIGRGPIFKSGYEFGDAFENIHLMSLMCRALRIQCPANDGNLNRVAHLLSTEINN